MQKSNVFFFFFLFIFFGVWFFFSKLKKNEIFFLIFHALESWNERNGYSIFTDKLKLKQLTLFFFFSLVLFFLSIILQRAHWMRHIRASRCAWLLCMYCIVWISWIGIGFFLLARTTLNTWRLLSVKTKWKKKTIEIVCVWWWQRQVLKNQTVTKHPNWNL